MEVVQLDTSLHKTTQEVVDGTGITMKEYTPQQKIWFETKDPLELIRLLSPEHLSDLLMRDIKVKIFPRTHLGWTQPPLHDQSTMEEWIAWLTWALETEVAAAVDWAENQLTDEELGNGPDRGWHAAIVEDFTRFAVERDQCTTIRWKLGPVFGNPAYEK